MCLWNNFEYCEYCGSNQVSIVTKDNYIRRGQLPELFRSQHFLPNERPLYLHWFIVLLSVPLPFSLFVLLCSSCNRLSFSPSCRKEMISPTNSILTGLALADMLVMLDYIPFAVHNYLLVGLQTEELFSHSWAVFALFHAHFSVVCHACSTWLTVLLAVWRYIYVRCPAEAKIWCSQKRALMCITATYISVVIACIPVYLSFTITPRTTGQSTTYRVSLQS